MALIKHFFNQTRKPEGFLGKLMLATMNSGHAKLANWGMKFLPQLSMEQIAELGCGAGRNVGELLRIYPNAKVTAVDYSPLSVEKTRAYNKAVIDAGRCTAQLGDVSDLKLEEASFDLVTAFETVYFWPGLEDCFAQVARILKPGGTFLIVNESTGVDATSRRFEKIIDGMRLYTPEQLRAALEAAGFTQVTINRHKSKPWIAVLTRRGGGI